MFKSRCFVKQGEPRSPAWDVGGLPSASLARQGWGAEVLLGLLGAGIVAGGSQTCETSSSWLLCFESSLGMARQRIGQVLLERSARNLAGRTCVSQLSAVSVTKSPGWDTQKQG